MSTVSGFVVTVGDLCFTVPPIHNTCNVWSFPLIDRLFFVPRVFVGRTYHTFRCIVYLVLSDKGGCSACRLYGSCRTHFHGRGRGLFSRLDRWFILGAASTIHPTGYCLHEWAFCIYFHIVISAASTFFVYKTGLLVAAATSPDWWVKIKTALTCLRPAVVRRRALRANSKKKRCLTSFACTCMTAFAEGPLV